MYACMYVCMYVYIYNISIILSLLSIIIIVVIVNTCSLPVNRSGQNAKLMLNTRGNHNPQMFCEPSRLLPSTLNLHPQYVASPLFGYFNVLTNIHICCNCNNNAENAVRFVCCAARRSVHVTRRP